MEQKEFSFESKSERETIFFGEILGSILSGGQVVALIGELGAGKTTLVKGMVKGLGVQDRRSVKSPTFSLVHKYQGRLPVYHIDAYRLTDAHELIDVGCDEMLYGNNISLVEWANNVQECLPEEYIEVTLTSLSESRRKIVICCHGKSSENIIHSVQDALRKIQPEAVQDTH